MTHNFEKGDVVIRTSSVNVKSYEKEMTVNGIYTVTNIYGNHIEVEGSNRRWASINFKLIKKGIFSQLIEIL